MKRLRPSKCVAPKTADDVTNTAEDTPKKAVQRGVVIKKQVRIAPYTTKTGKRVPLHTARRDIGADGDTGEDMQPQIDWGTITKKIEAQKVAKREERAAARRLEDEAAKLSPILEPTQMTVDEVLDFINDRHTSSVLSFSNEFGKHGFFRPASGEIWSHKDTPFVSDINDGKLGHRGVLAFAIGNELGMTNIPKTEWVHVTAKESDKGTGETKDKIWGHGSYQMSILEFDPSSKPFDIAIGELIKGNSLDAATVEATPEFRNLVRTGMKNGGMDLAVLDYITGNANRHSSNLFISNKDGNCMIGGIDNHLCFPSATKLKTSDFHTSMNSIWTYATQIGSDIECSDSFKECMVDDLVKDRIEKHLNATHLQEAAKSGALQRFEHVKRHLKETGRLNGHDLGRIIVNNLQE